MDNGYDFKKGFLADFSCRECGLYVIIDAMVSEYDYDYMSGKLQDVIQDSDGRHKEQITCECGCELFDRHDHN